MSDSEIEVRYQVEDGYVGKSRPQRFEIELNEFQHCETHTEYEMCLDELIQEEFNQCISWGCENYTDIIEAAKLYNATEEE